MFEKSEEAERCSEISDMLSTNLFLSVVAFVAAPSLVDAFSPPHRGISRFFLDTADTSEWDDLLKLGLFHGVTTNPALLERANQSCTVDNLHRLARKALEQTDEFMCQTWGATSKEMYNTGMALSEIDRDRVVIKVPVTKMGTEAATNLSNSGVRICMTACYNNKQALIAAAAGVGYIAPYLGRMNDNGKDGMSECQQMQDIVNGLGSDTRILVASIRNAETLADLAAAGLDTFTFSPEVTRDLFDEPLTDKAAAEFEEAATRGSDFPYL